MDPGIQAASKHAIDNPLPLSWLGRPDMPPALPAYANIEKLSAVQVRNLQAQIGYTQSVWNYKLIGGDNQLGRYQFTTDTLESYGILAAGSNQAYDTDCVNYKNCWRTVTIKKTTNGYANYLYDNKTLNDFLSNTSAQEYLAYQVIYDLYNNLSKIEAIQDTDSSDVIAGMISVAWVLGVGTTPTFAHTSGTGAYAWRYHNVGAGEIPYNQGRYTMAVLSQ
jgi:hypothetical protein